MKVYLAAAMVFAGCAAPARAEWMSGEQLAEVCLGAVPVDRAMCLSYVMGVMDGVRYLDAPPRTPVGTSAGEVRDVVVAYLGEHPEARGLQGREIVRAAVVAAWPKVQPKVPVRKAAVRKRRP
ncbi:MAG: Rap1a/Tai family immunity protein [Novosphingobium sp.]